MQALLNAGLIRETGSLETGKGRRPIMLTLAIGLNNIVNIFNPQPTES